jgi:hypothetical protein
MSDIVFNDKPTTTFWIVGGAALIWNLIGLVFYIGHVTISPEALAAMPQLQQDFFVETPTWAVPAVAQSLGCTNVHTVSRVRDRSGH